MYAPSVGPHHLLLYLKQQLSIIKVCISVGFSVGSTRGPTLRKFASPFAYYTITYKILIKNIGQEFISRKA